MTKKVLQALVGLVIIAMVWFVVATRSSNNRSVKNTQPVVAATIFPLAAIAEQVAGDYVSVVTVLPPGASPHTFEARPSDIRALESADAVFAVGYGLDAWVLELVDHDSEDKIVQLDAGVDLLDFAEGHEHEADDEVHDEDEHMDNGHDEHEHESDGHHHEAGSVDPHYWLSIHNAQHIAENIVLELSSLYPEFADGFAQNAREYDEVLVETDAAMRALLRDLPSNELITFHDSWNYFATEYGLEIAGVFESSPGKEPTAQYLSDLYATAQEHEVDVVFTEPQLSSGVVEPFVKDLGLSIATLDPLGGLDGRKTYTELMLYNAQVVHDALAQ